MKRLMNILHDSIQTMCIRIRVLITLRIDIWLINKTITTTKKHYLHFGLNL